jgi:hypothetical protein
MAIAALDSVCPEGGRLFGEHDYRRLLRLAATAAGIDNVSTEARTPPAAGHPPADQRQLLLPAEVIVVDHGGYAICFGVLLIALGFRLRMLGHQKLAPA